AAQAAAMDERLRGMWGIQPGVRSAHALDDVHRLLAAVRALPGFAELTDAVERFGRLLRPAPGRGRMRRGPGFKRLVGFTWWSGWGLRRRPSWATPSWRTCSGKPTSTGACGRSVGRGIRCTTAGPSSAAWTFPAA